MNAVKGLNRIALIIAIVSIIPGFLSGWKAYFHLTKKEISKKELEWAQSDPMYKRLRMAILEDLYHEPKWKCAVAGFSASAVTFAVVLFTLRGLNRIVLWRVFEWVVDGFKDPVHTED